MTDAPDPGLTDLVAADLNSHTWGNEYENAAHEEHSFDGGCKICRRAIGAIADRVALVVEQHTNGRIAELEAELEKYHAEERRELEWDRFCAQQDVRCTECGLRYGERKDYTCPHIGEHKYDADELRAALEGEQQ